MAYKEQIKENELITKIRIIRYVKRDHVPVGQVAKAFSCHRNTITNILTLFEKQINLGDQNVLLGNPGQVSLEILHTRYKGLLAQKRIPKTHKRKAPEALEGKIVDFFTKDGIKVGVLGMKLYLARKYDDDMSLEAKALKNLSVGKLRGIYKRNTLTVQKVRSANGERKPLYDYFALGCFDKMHYDVKHILDKHALPQNIYEILSQKEIPKYEWNIIDAKSRFRFIAYSYNLNSSFGLWYLLFVILFLRRNLIAYDLPIIIGEDNGLEFCSGSKRKEGDWNKVLNLLNSSIYSYEPYFDIRKNLIERSHRTDDEALFIPRGHLMNTKESFRKEVENYSYYFNLLRPHSGIAMNGRTPYGVVKDSGLAGIDRLKDFPVLILDEVIDPLRKLIQPILFEQFAKENPETIQKAQTDQKARRNLEVKFPFLFNAQDVLTYYRSYPNPTC